MPLKTLRDHRIYTTRAKQRMTTLLKGSPHPLYALRGTAFLKTPLL